MGYHRKIKLGQVHRVLLLRTNNRNKKKLDGSYFSFTENAGIMLNKDSMPFGKRVKGPIPLMFRKKKFIKMFSVLTDFIE